MRARPIPHGAFARHAPNPAADLNPGTAMLDILLLGLGLGVFALLAGYAAGCERV